ncbi:hypothetical protein [Streptomyces sp. NPDC096311]|uniref:hypothetical protein n=1 Tax=Streptomyces sp. NPDC096311 TaxID=3366083 RepID=UPI0038268FFA
MSQRTITPPAYAEYQALLDHGVKCYSCRAVPERECPRAGALRRQWSAVRRTACVGGTR